MRQLTHDFQQKSELFLPSDACGHCSRFHVPLFGHGVGSVAVKDREVKTFLSQELLYGTFKEVPIRSVLAPLEMPLVHVRPVNFIPADGETIPLNPRVKDVENVVEGLIRREFSLGSSLGTGEMR